MRTRSLPIAERPEDIASLPAGSQILTAHHKIFEMDQIEEGRKDSGTRYWIEPGTLQPFPADGLDHWFPALILPENM